MDYSIILDFLIDEMEEDYTPSFMEENGIKEVERLGIKVKEGIEEVRIIFKDEISRDKFIKEWDLGDFIH